MFAGRDVTKQTCGTWNNIGVKLSSILVSKKACLQDEAFLQKRVSDVTSLLVRFLLLLHSF